MPSRIGAHAEQDSPENFVLNCRHTLMWAAPNSTDDPRRTVTLRYTFFDGNHPMSEPVYGRFSSGAFSGRESWTLESNNTETPKTLPEEWAGESAGTEVTGFSADGS